MKTHNIMIDIETLGCAPGSVIMSTGAVYFQPGWVPTLDDADDFVFYGEISQTSCIAAGLVCDEATRQWWAGVTDLTARGVVERTAAAGAKPLAYVLGQFAQWLRKHRDAGFDVWARGPSFDLALLASAYRAIGVELPWRYQDERCVRTVASLPMAAPFESKGECHHALMDALAQARQVAETLGRLKDGGQS
ncbi:MAG: 3'-5' exonuclease [Comamonadaceae bacterium]|nr:3'-5' exonuclease [Comamonadaceae bacterium]